MLQDPPPYIAVVPRGETGILRVLRESLKDQGLAEVIWDRRVVERRRNPSVVAEHRRLGERRCPPHDTWALGFIVATRHAGGLSPCKTIAAPE